jgi:hypothetical protein
MRKEASFLWGNRALLLIRIPGSLFIVNRAHFLMGNKAPF